MLALQQPLTTGQIRNCENKMWYPFTMRVLTASDLPRVLALYDYVVGNMENPDMLWRYPDETVAAFLGQDGIVIGTFIDQDLIGLRVMYFHHVGDQTNPLLGNIKSDYGKTAHLALCVIQPQFRGNSLQKQMGIQMMKVAEASRTFQTMCSIVSPHNYPSISDKFYQNMAVVKLMPKFRGIWRYIFYRNMVEPLTPVDEKLIFAASRDYSHQTKLLDAGYYGVQLGARQGEMGMFFKKYQ